MVFIYALFLTFVSDREMTASEIAAELECPSFLPERKKYCVYRAAIATFYVPSCGNRIGGMRREWLENSPSAPYNGVLLKNPSRVARILLFYSDGNQPLACVLGMKMVSREGKIWKVEEGSKLELIPLPHIICPVKFQKQTGKYFVVKEGRWPDVECYADEPKPISFIKATKGT